MNYASIDSNPQQPPRGIPRRLNFWNWSVQMSAPGAKVVFQYPTQELDLMVNFFLKGKMSDPGILYICQVL